MCRIQKRVYVAADGTVEQTFENTYPCGRMCLDVERMPDEFYDQITDPEEDDLSDSKGSDMETEVGEGSRKPPRSKPLNRSNEHRFPPPPSEAPSSAYFSARSDAYFSVMSDSGTSAQQQK